MQDIYVVGIGMTNLSMVFMQQLRTVDMLLFCITNGIVFIPGEGERAPASGRSPC